MDGEDHQRTVGGLLRENAIRVVENGLEKRKETSWTTSQLGGGIMHGGKKYCAKTAWCGDGQYNVVPSGRSLRMFLFRSSDEVNEEVKTLTRVRTLMGHADTIRAVVSLGRYRCITGSADGTARLWDVSDGVSLRTIDLGQPVKAMAGHENPSDRVYVALGPEIRRIEVMKGKTEAVVNIACTLLALWTKMNVLVAVRGKAVYLFNGEIGFDNRSYVCMHHLRKIKTIAVRESDGSLAIGDDLGVITIFHNLLRQCEGQVKGKKNLLTTKLKQSKMHWHSSAVLSLSFINEGFDLLSGGSEGVLVKWELNTGKRRFLPRLGGAIRAISVNPNSTVYSVTCGDNAVRYVSAQTFSVIAQVRGIRPANAFQINDYEDPLTLVADRSNPGVTFVVGLPTALQLYDIWRDEHVSDVVVNSRNTLFTYRDQESSGQGTRSKVRFASVGPGSEDLVTVDVLQSPATEEDTLIAETIRFWKLTPTTKTYQLVAKMERPHGDTRITSLSHHPTEPLVVTTSVLGEFKTWRRKSDSDLWSCFFVGSYRGLSSACSAFSKDGSLLAVGFGPLVTLWSSLSDRETKHRSEVPSVLKHGPADEKIIATAFPGSLDSPFVITASRRSIQIWNVITQSIWWSARIQVSALVADPLSSVFAVDVELGGVGGSANNRNTRGVVLFDLSSPVPLKVLRTDVRVTTMTFVAKSASQSALVLLNERKELQTVAEAQLVQKIQEDLNGTEALNADTSKDDSALVSNLFGLDMSTKREQSEVSVDRVGGKEDDHDDEDEENSNPWRMSAARALTAFDAPTHTLPPPTQTALEFFSKLLANPRASRHDSEYSQHSDEEDADDEDDVNMSAEKERIHLGRQERPSRKRSGIVKSHGDDFFAPQQLDKFAECFMKS